MEVKLTDVLLIAVLGVGGVFAARELAERKAEGPRANTAAGNELATGAPAPGGLLTGALPAGTTPAPVVNGPGGMSPAAILAEQQRQTAELQRQQRIDDLRRELSNVNDRQDILLVQANTLKNRAPDESFRRGVSDRVWAECRKAGSWISQAYRCNDGNMAVAVQREVERAWAVQIADDLKPLQAELSQLQSRQSNLVQNLMALGYPVPTAQTRQVTI